MVRPIGERIAATAIRELGNKACGPNTVDGHGYFSSCANHHAAEPWCADFARWVWTQAHALHADKLTAAAASFAKYGAVRQRNPRVGDAVLFGYDGVGFAKHVAIVVRVLPHGKIVSIGGNEGPSDDTSRVTRDGPYDGAFGSSDPLAPNGPVSGYISAVEDEMPFTKKQIVQMVQEGIAAAVTTEPTKADIKRLIKQGVEAELKAVLDTTGVSAAQGAKAAVDTDHALAGISQQLSALATQVAALTAAASPPAVTPPATGNGPGAGTGRGTRTGRGTGTDPGTGTSAAAGTGQAS